MERIEKLRQKLIDFDGFYITSRAGIFYYSGFTSEDAALIITRSEMILITDSRYLIQAKNQAPNFRIYNSADGINKLFSNLKLQKIGYEENYLTMAEYNRLKENSKADLSFAGEIISEPRRIKSPNEIKKINAAESLGDAAFSHILTKIHAGITELEVALEIESFMRKNGASGTSFETIVASGVRSALPHGVATDKVIENGDFVTMDFGCILDGYCSDMTRTIVVGKASSKQREIYNIVLNAQKEAIKAISPNVACKTIDEAARNIINAAGYGAQFGHSLGHSVGIEIHESPNFSPKSCDCIQYGNVITVEPGIYIEDFGGVRIEDVIAITPENILNLTKSEKELIII